MIEVKNISKSFDRKEILKDISFIINKGECVSIIGQSGIGKSVLLKSIIGLITNHYDEKINILEVQIFQLNGKIDSQALMIASLEATKEVNVHEINQLKNQYTQLDEDFKNYHKVSIVKNLNTQLYEKDTEIKILKKFLTEQGKIIPGHVTGVCSKHQRHLGKAIKQARNIALLSYSLDPRHF